MIDLVEEFWDPELIERLYAVERGPSPDDFRDALHQRFGRRGQLVLTGSARQALTILLARVADGSRRRVLLSSFNCRVVRESVLAAGLEVDTFDFSEANGRIDWAAVAHALRDEHLAIIVPHFFGIPSDFGVLVPVAKRKKVFIIEDCAHSFGATVAEATAGQMGDAAVFSFNYDKPISLAGGGAMLINNSAVRIERAAVEAAPPRRIELRQFRRMASALRHGRNRGVGRSLRNRISARLHAVPKVPTGIGSLRAAVGIWQLERYDEIRKKRDQNARTLLESMGHLSWYVGANVTPAYLKLRIIVDSADAVSAVGQCRKHGITVVNSNWPKTVDSNPDDNRNLNAVHAASFGLDVPIHQNLSPVHIAQIASAFSSARKPKVLCASGIGL